MLCSIGFIWWPYGLRIAKQLLPSGWPLNTPGSHMAFLSNFNSGWPQLTFARPLTPSMHHTLAWGPFYHFWWPQGISKEFDLWLTSGWLVHDLWPQQCITLWSWVISTKFGGHRALWSKLTPSWPQSTPSWSLTPAIHYTLVRDSSHQIWWP